MNLILASKSPYRKLLLEQAGLAFEVITSSFDEALFSEKNVKLPPPKLCLELAKQKALSVADSHAGNFIIGSDQLIELDEKILGKPGSLNRAADQLSLLSGRTHLLHTSLTLVAANKKMFTAVRTTTIKLRALSHEEIDAYLRVDHPIDCAGSYKLERAGLLLAESLECTDPSAAQGLSLIDLSLGFKHFGRSPFEFLKEMP